MKRLLILLLIAVLCVGQVAGLSLDFQDTNELGDHVTCVGTATCSWYQSATGGNNYILLNPNIVFVTAGIRNTNPEPFTYAAANMNMATNVFSEVELSDGSGVSLYTTAVGHLNGRVEVKMNGGNAYIYENGVLKYTSPVLAVNPSYVTWRSRHQAGTSGTVDDFVIGSNPYIFNSPESTYYLKKDMITPAASGLYNSAGALISSTNMFSQYSRGNTATPPDPLVSENVVLKNLQTGTIYSTYPTGTNYTESFNWNVYNAIINSTAPYGSYVTTITGTGTTSEPIMYLGGGATVSFDKDVYSVGDSGSVVTYVSAGGYWDPALYTYKLDIQDIYGTVKQSTPITTASGTVSVSWTDSDSLGVWYAILKATPIAGGDPIWMNYDWAELQAYIVFSGYVMNAETGAVLPDAYINVTQGTAMLSQFSMNPSGAWNSSNNWLSGAAFSIVTNKTGYTTDTLTFTPLTAKSIFLNLSLVPNPATTVGVSIGGIVRDNVYGNPVVNATYHTKYLSDEYTATTNIAGFARTDSLAVPNVIYDVWSSKVGWGNSTVVQKLAVAI